MHHRIVNAVLHTANAQVVCCVSLYSEMLNKVELLSRVRDSHFVRFEQVVLYTLQLKLATATAQS